MPVDRLLTQHYNSSHSLSFLWRPVANVKGFVYLLLLLWTIICELYARYLDKDWGWLQETTNKKYRIRSDDAT